MKYVILHHQFFSYPISKNCSCRIMRNERLREIQRSIKNVLTSLETNEKDIKYL